MHWQIPSFPHHSRLLPNATRIGFRRPRSHTSNHQPFPRTYCWELVTLLNKALFHGDIRGKGNIPSFLTSAADGRNRSVSRLDRFTPGETATSNHWTGGWMDSRASLDGTEKRTILSLLGIDPPPSSPQLVAIPTEQSCSLFFKTSGKIGSISNYKSIKYSLHVTLYIREFNIKKQHFHTLINNEPTFSQKGRDDFFLCNSDLDHVKSSPVLRHS
jgi:hypothetical protein